MKKLIALSLVLCLTIFSTVVYAKDKVETNTLTKSEIKTLVNDVGLTEDEIATFPVDVARNLIKMDAKKLAAPGPKDYDLTSEGETKAPGDVSTQALTSSDITLNGYAFKVTSDRVGEKKIYLYGSFDWKIIPTWKLTDAMSIGYPVTNQWYLPMSGGVVQQHKHQIEQYNAGNMIWEKTTSTTADGWDNGTGVFADYDLIANRTDWKGYIEQNVYVKSTVSGKSNVKIRYGHQIVSGEPSFGVYPAGLSVTPATKTETLDYGFEFAF